VDAIVSFGMEFALQIRFLGRRHQWSRHARLEVQQQQRKNQQDPRMVLHKSLERHNQRFAPPPDQQKNPGEQNPNGNRTGNQAESNVHREVVGQGKSFER
jgi:hypothetical protein